jgi:hypothetical protein
MITQDDKNIESLPWYRYGMVWLIIMLPATVVVAALFTVAIAMQNAPILNNHSVNKLSAEPAKIEP